MTYKKPVDWQKRLSSAAKAEMLAATIHILSDHMPEVWEKVPSWLRAQIKQAMKDCSIDYKALNKADIANCIAYGRFLTQLYPPQSRWVEWIEPFGPNNEPVYMRVPEQTTIAVMKKAHPELTDAQALEEFMVVNWAAFS